MRKIRLCENFFFVDSADTNPNIDENEKSKKNENDDPNNPIDKNTGLGKWEIVIKAPEPRIEDDNDSKKYAFSIFADISATIIQKIQEIFKFWVPEVVLESQTVAIGQNRIFWMMTFVVK